MNKAILSDCMDYMQGIQDGAFDLAVVDPPYGDAGYTYQRGGVRLSQGRGWLDKYKSADDSFAWDVAPSEDYFTELFRVSKNAIIWGGNYFALPPCRCFLVW